MVLSSIQRSPAKVAAVTALVMMVLFIAYEHSASSTREPRYVSDREATKCSCEHRSDNGAKDPMVDLPIADVTSPKRDIKKSPQSADVTSPKRDIKKTLQSSLKYLRPGSKPQCKNGEIDHGCYCVEGENTYPPVYTLLPEKVLTQRGCKQRRPDVIIPGSMKCGTTALKAYLEIHPAISFAEKELHFVNHHEVEEFDQYDKVMPYSTPDQLALEKTPGYILGLSNAEKLREAMPDVKLIFIFREPIARTVSNFMHLLAWNESKPGILKKIDKPHHAAPQYQVKSTFEESVIHPNGSMQTRNRLLDSSLYVKHLKKWYANFPQWQILILDGDEMTHNPLPGLKQIEKFLKIDPFFDEGKFYFNETKGFFCLREPYDMCMKSVKGRPHISVSEDVTAKLQEFFRPYNRELAKFIGRELSWTNSY